MKIFQILSTVDRAHLIDDAFNLARARVTSYNTALDMTSYLHKELDYLPWDSAASGFGYISSMLEQSSSYGLLNVSINLDFFYPILTLMIDSYNLSIIFLIDFLSSDLLVILFI